MVFIILEVCEPIKDTLLFIEQKYLDLKPKYNICKNAYNTQGVVFTQERKDKIGYATKHRVIKDSTRIKLSYISKNCDWNKKQRKVTEMFDLNGNLLKEFPSITDAAKYIGCENCRVNIKRTAQGKRNIAYGYIWKYKK